MDLDFSELLEDVEVDIVMKRSCCHIGGNC